MQAKHTALILAAGFMLLPTLSWSQFPGQGGSGGWRGMSMDPDQLFNFASKGRDVIVVSELDGMSKMMFDRMSSRLGLSGNEITREQFRGAMTRATEMAKSGEPSGMSFRPAEVSYGMPGTTMSRPGGESSDRDRRRDEYFRRLDRNEDGELEYDELSGDPIAEGLQTERSKYDGNGNGFIDPSEFKTYMTARFPTPEGGVDNSGGPGAPGAPKDGDERKRPTIIRAGNLPRDFPYAALDIDLDGQIGLYEWKSGGKKIAEFLPLDLNNDGFMTVEEFYRKRKQESASASSEYGRGGLNSGDPRTMAMSQGGNRGFGGGDRGMIPGGSGFGGGDRSRGFGGFGGGDRWRGPTGTPGGFGGNPEGAVAPSSGMPGRFSGMAIPGASVPAAAGPDSAVPGGDQRGPGRGNRGPSGTGESDGEPPRLKGTGR